MSLIKYNKNSKEEIKKKIQAEIVSFIENTLNIDVSEGNDISMEDNYVDRSEFEDNLDSTIEEIFKIIA